MKKLNIRDFYYNNEDCFVDVKIHNDRYVVVIENMGVCDIIAYIKFHNGNYVIEDVVSSIYSNIEGVGANNLDTLLAVVADELEAM